MANVREFSGSSTRLATGWEDLTPDMGVDTRAWRTAVPEHKAAWLEGWQPIGQNNIVSVLGPSDAQATIPNDMGVFEYIYPFQLRNGSYIAACTSSGGVVIYDAISFATLAAWPSYTWMRGMRFTVWQDTHLFGICKAGMVVWDGATLFLPTGISPFFTVATGGSYSATPTVTVSTGGGSGATLTAIMAITAAVPVSPGSGFVAGDVVTLSTGTPTDNTDTQLMITSVNGSGGVLGMSVLTSSSYKVVPSVASGTVGGSGFGLTVTCTYTVVDVLVTAPGLGYVGPTGLALVFGSGAATGTCFPMPTGIAGTDIEVLGESLWFINGNTYGVSAGGNPIDFSAASLGVINVESDHSIGSGYKALVKTASYMYMYGETATNVASGVDTNGILQKVTVDQSVGTSAPDTAIAFRGIVTAFSPTGFYATSGTTAQKVSDELDGFIDNVPRVNGVLTMQPSSAVVHLNDKLCLATLFRYTDAELDTERSVMAIWDGSIWFFASQNYDLVSIGSMSINNVVTLYGVDDTHIYTLFDNETTVYRRYISRLISGEQFMYNKQATKMDLVVHNAVSNLVGQYFNVFAESEYKALEVAYDLPHQLLEFVTTSNIIIQWEGTVAFDFVVPRVVSFTKLDQYGFFLGLRFESTMARLDFSHVMIEYVSTGTHGT